MEEGDLLGGDVEFVETDTTPAEVLASGVTAHRPAMATATEVGFAGGLSSVLVTGRSAHARATPC